MGRKKLAKKDKKVRLSIWKTPKDIEVLGGVRAAKRMLTLTFDGRVIVLKQRYIK